jgi:hypothetical protein
MCLKLFLVASVCQSPMVLMMATQLDTRHFMLSVLSQHGSCCAFLCCRYAFKNLAFSKIRWVHHVCAHMCSVFYLLLCR